MRILIDLDPNIYTRLFDNGITVISFGDAIEVSRAIRKGTPLPEHHGDLKDVSKLVYDCSYENGNGCDRICHCDDCNYHVVRESDIKNLPTIIPATKEKSCEDCTNWNEHYGTAECMLCENRNLWISKQTATEEGDRE